MYKAVNNFSNVKQSANILGSTPIKRDCSPIMATSNKRYTIDYKSLPLFEYQLSREKL